MDEENAVEPATEAGRAIYAAFAGPVPGREIDVRPDPGGIRAADETQVLRLPPSVGRSSALPPPAASLWPDGNTTGAFVSRAASLRHEVAPYRWWNVAWWMVAVWVIAVGLPVGAGVWAALEIWRRMHHG